MLLVEPRRKMICVANLVHNPLSRGNGSSEKLSRTELLPLRRSAEKLWRQGNHTLTGLPLRQAVQFWVSARNSRLDASLTWGRATKFDIPSPRNPSMMSSCTGLAKFIAASAIAAMRVRARKLKRVSVLNGIQMRFTNSASAARASLRDFYHFLGEYHSRRGQPHRARRVRHECCLICDAV
jgi:hypothetical protein